MRISTSQMFQQRVTSMLEQQVKIARTELQLSSGKRLITPADDPSASLRDLQLTERIGQNTQYLDNLGRAQSRLELEEGALASGVNLLQRVRELAVTALNGTLSPADMQLVEVEARQLLEELIAVGNTQNSSGEYLFAGYQTDVTPFADGGGGNVNYSGDQGQLHLQVSPTRQLAVSDSGADVFLGVSLSSGTGSVFDVVDDLADALAAGTPASTSLDDLDAALDHLLAVRADVGSRMRAVEDQREANLSFTLVLEQEQSDLVDLDYTEAIARFNQELLALQASEQVFSRTQDLSLFNFL